MNKENMSKNSEKKTHPLYCYNKLCIFFNNRKYYK